MSAPNKPVSMKGESQPKLPGQEDIPPELMEALCRYAEKIGRMRVLMKKNDTIDAVETQTALDDFDRRAVGIVDVLAEHRESHRGSKWWIAMFGKGQWRKPGAISRKRGVAARLFLILRGELPAAMFADDVPFRELDPSPYHRPLSESELYADEPMP